MDTQGITKWQFKGEDEKREIFTNIYSKPKEKDGTAVKEGRLFAVTCKIHTLYAFRVSIP